MGVKISELSEASSVQNSDVLPIVQNGETKKIQVETLGSQKVNKSGDTLTGELNFQNKNDYAIVRKTRTIDGVDYNANLGIGVNQSARIEFQDANQSNLGALEVRASGIYNGVSGKKLAEQSIGWTNATLTSKLKSTGAIKYTKIGNVVIVNFVDIEVNSSIASHGDILATGLPNSTIYLISALFNYGTPSKPIRIGITTDGKIQTHYSNSFTASEANEFYGTIVYMTNQ